MVSLEFSTIHIHDPSAAEAKSLMCLKNRLFFFVSFFYFYSLSTLHICLYFNVLDRIIKYFPNIISLKKATKSVFGQKHFCL